ncbi:MAG: PDZ domain-containing protein [Phycisphaerae bacterium]|nr:PDZ domain-containing protein [Phycisphaerae bacterium]
MSFLPIRFVGLSVRCCLVLPFVGLGTLRADESRDISQHATASLQAACREIIAGRIDEGARSVRSLVASQTKSADLLQVGKWVDQYEGLQAERDRFRQVDYDYEVAKAKRAVKKGEWLEAMIHLVSAFDTAKDPKAFVQLPDIKSIFDGATTEAEGLYKKGEWAKAARIYACFEHIFKDNPEYEAQKRRSLRHARLEIIYKKENKEKWGKDLQGIEPSMVRDAFRQVGRNYVRNAEFKKALAGGIENLLVLAKTTNLANTFERLGDREEVARFVGELTSLSRRIEENIDWRKAWDYFEDILKINGRTLQLPQSLIVNEFMEGALQPLDRFSSMVWPADVEEFKKHTMGRFQGVGIQIRKRQDGKLLVVSPLPNTPAHRAGIKPGDVILKVDGDDIGELEIDDVVPKIMGPKGTTVKLTIQRGKKAPFIVSIERDVITIRSIRGYRRTKTGEWDYMMDPEQRIGYIRIDPSFMDGTVQEIKDALDKLNKQGARALILDLRFNPGGLLRTAIDVTELFLPPGKGIVSTRGQHSDQWAAESSAEEFFDKDMVVLVNETSASASEILAGALQDNRRAIVLGTCTHGKGSVQNLIPLANDTAYLKLTTALYYLPSNRCPDKRPDAEIWGVPPDIDVPMRPEERMKVIQMRRDSDILGELPPDPSTQPTTSQATTSQASAEDDEPTTTAPTPIEERPDIDPQAEAALLLLRVKLLSGQPWAWSGQPASSTVRKTASTR